MSRQWIGIASRILWALWFGGIIALFVSVQTLFHAVPREMFSATAPHLFFAFERYQLVLAASNLSAALLWRVLQPRSAATAIFCTLAIATLIAVVETAVITPRIEQLRIAGQTHSPKFTRLHGGSMGMYVLESIVLLFAGILIMRSNSFERETAPAIALAKSSPVVVAHPAH